MSNSAHPVSNEPSDRKVFYSAIGWIGVIALFALIVFVAYLPNRSESFYEQNTEQRLSIRSTIDAEQKNLTENYSWENQSGGVVRLPVVVAKELTVAELRAQEDAK